MVYFECQKCNESLKKPKVEKHLQSCGSWAVSCIDCSKVFQGDEWKAHTSCMSEAQKYQGSLFKGDKESSNKGQKKQDVFLSNVQEIVKSASVSPKLRESLDWMLSFENIPRKEKGFRNFASNSMKVWDPKIQGELWEVVKRALAMPAQAAAQSSSPKAENAEETGATPKKEEKEETKNEKKGKTKEDEEDSEEKTEKPEKARRKEAGAAQEKGKKWTGWKRTMDGELQKAGGEMPWKKLRNAMVSAYLEFQPEVEQEHLDEQELRREALASIPEEYLSSTDNLVRKPEMA